MQRNIRRDAGRSKSDHELPVGIPYRIKPPTVESAPSLSSAAHEGIGFSQVIQTLIDCAGLDYQGRIFRKAGF